MTETSCPALSGTRAATAARTGNCVEVARNLPGLVAVRDSKEPDGAKLVVSLETWRASIRSV